MRLRRDVPERIVCLGDPRLPGLPVGLTAEQFLADSGNAADPVPDDHAPPDDMPLSLMVLNSLADDAETIYTMRGCGEMEPFELALVGERYLRQTLRALLNDGLIEVEEETLTVDDHHLILRRPPGPPPTNDADLRRYWYVMTPAGWDVWRAGSSDLRAYQDAHPLRPRR